MPAVQVVSSRPLTGKTTVASGLGRGFSHQTEVTLLRCGQGAPADADAATFAGFLFASTPGRALAASEIPTVSANGLQIVELDAGLPPLDDLPALFVFRGGPSDDDETAGRALAGRLLGSIATNVAPAAVEATARDLTNAGLRPLALLPEDRVLAAPCVAEIRDALRAEVLFEGENELEVVQDIVVGPVFADPARAHFRRFASKAVLAPFNKTDLHLAAIESEAACLIITGGGRPSPYVLDRAQREATTVLIAEPDTPGTIAALADVFGRGRFRGESKVEAALTSLSARLDLEALLRRIEGGS